MIVSTRRALRRVTHCGTLSVETNSILSQSTRALSFVWARPAPSAVPRFLSGVKSPTRSSVTVSSNLRRARRTSTAPSMACSSLRQKPKAAPRLLTRSAQLTQPTVRLPQQGTYEKKQSIWLLALSVFLQLLPNHQATINFGSILPTRGLTPAVLRWSGFTPADSFATLGLEICGRLSKKKCTLG